MPRTRDVNPQDYIEPGTGFAQTVGYLLLGLSTLAGIFATFGVALIILFVAWIVYYFRAKVAMAQLHGSALRVGPKQFPEIHEHVAEIADALDMDPPEVYIVESNQQNAFAVKIGAKKSIVLFDDIIFGSQQTNNPDVLRFIIAHELAHHALGHTGLVRSQVSLLYRPLARLDELSCDAVAAAAVGQDAGRQALSLLLVGPQLFHKVNTAALERQALQVEDDRNTKKAEKQLFYPLMLRRIARMIPDEDDRERPSKSSKGNRYDREDEDDDR